ncbi:MAG: acetyl-CoA carboxylase biotin carboxyl carrier protein subunit [Longimicrobiales bacterium]
MRYFVTIRGRTFEVDLSGSRPRIDGREVSADLAGTLDSPARHLLIDGRSYPLVAGRGTARGVWELHIDGARLQAEAIDERTRAIREMTAAAGAPPGPRPVAAPMPGLVVRIEVEPGQTVAAGQGVAIVEAMKMENELKAEAAGRVARVLVQAGQTVEKGAVLIEFDAISA